MSDKLEMIWREAVVAYLRQFPRYLSGSVNRNHKNHSQDCRYPAEETNPIPSEYKPQAGSLDRSVWKHGFVGMMVIG
jgi:hypothetical protein